MKSLSTHVLDTSRGLPAAGIAVRLFQGGRELNARTTDADGRCANLLADGESLIPGIYRLLFELAAYFPEGFYPEVSVVFKVSADSTHLHVPLLVSPFGYTTYRGS